MPKLKSLLLQNFGPFSEFFIEFDPDITIIRGANRVGKTWTLRALSQVLYNNLGWAESVKHGAKFFRLTLTLDDGTKIIRFRDAYKGGRNEYEINGTVYGAVGFGFFAPVGEVTGIRPVQFRGHEDMRFNIRTPTEPPFFLIGEGEQVQATMISRLVGADIVERAAALTQTEINKLAETEQLTRQEAKSAEQAVGQYEWIVPGLVILDEADRTILASNKFNVLIGDISQTKLVYDQYGEAATTAAKQAEEIVGVQGKLQDLRERAIRAAGLRDAVTQWQTAVASLDEVGKSGERLEASKRAYTEARSAVERCLTLGEQRATISTYTEAVALAAKIHKDIEEQKERHSQLTEQRLTLLVDAGVCPLCGQSTKEMCGHDGEDPTPN